MSTRETSEARLARRGLHALAWIALATVFLLLQCLLAIGSTALQSCVHMSGELVVFALRSPACTLHPHIWLVAALRFGAVLLLVLPFIPGTRLSRMVASAALVSCMLRAVALLPVTMADGFGPGRADVATLLTHNRYEFAGVVLASVFVLLRGRVARPAVLDAAAIVLVTATLAGTLAYQPRFHDSSGTLAVVAAVLLCGGWLIGHAAEIGRWRAVRAKARRRP